MIRWFIIAHKLPASSVDVRAAIKEMTFPSHLGVADKEDETDETQTLFCAVHISRKNKRTRAISAIAYWYVP